MLFSESDILDFIEENDVKFIRMTFCDTFGNMKNIAIMPRELQRAISYGIPFNATGLMEAAHQSLLLKPDPSTLSVLPWRPQTGRVIRFFCNIYHMDGTPYSGDLRRNLRKTMKKCNQMGYHCEMGTRCEFYLFNLDEQGNPTHVPHDHGGYEIDFACNNPLTAADNMVHYKTVVKTIAAQNGLYASFMPKPIANENGSALKIALLIKKDGKSIFGDTMDTMQPEGRSFIAGILNRVREFTLFTNPTINSYERLELHSAPSHVNWSEENRIQLLQLRHTPGRDSSIELRCADAFCNPYLTFQLLLAAGFEGIQNQEQLTDDRNAANGTAVFQALPASLEEAWQVAAESAFVKKSLPEMIFRNYLEKTKQQLDAYQKTDDPVAFSYQQCF